MPDSASDISESIHTRTPYFDVTYKCGECSWTLIRELSDSGETLYVHPSYPSSFLPCPCQDKIYHAGNGFLFEGNSRWRVGSQVPLNIYEGNRPVCQCHNPEDARRIVEAMNRATA